MLPQRFFTCLIVIFTIIIVHIDSDSSNEDNTSEYPVADIIIKAGYPLEIHDVITEDGYILNIQRIKHGKNGKYNPKSQVAFLMHGLATSAHCFLVIKENLPFLLADNGYDVWLGNARGNRYSTKHILLDSSNFSSAYWDFSFHEIAVYDLPATINHIIEKTGQEKLYYIGHSQGTTTFFAMAWERPEINKYIKLMIAMAPAAFLGNVKNRLYKWASTNIGQIRMMIDSLRINGYLLSYKTVTNLVNYICRNRTVIPYCRLALLQTEYSYNDFIKNSQVPPEDLIKLNLEGVATREYYHMGQLIKSGFFRQFDFGEKENLIKYGTKEPPNYDLSKITSPIAMYYSFNDVYTQQQDVEKTIRSLPNVVYTYQINISDFNHVDYLIRKNIKGIIYEDILRMMKKYSIF